MTAHPAKAFGTEGLQLDSILKVEKLLEEGGAASIVGPGNERAPLPNSLYEVLRQAVAALKAGHTVAVVPTDRELTTQEAADLLNVSRPSLIRLLDQHELAYRLSGTHRRIELQHLLRYREARTAKRREAFSEMARDAQALGLTRT